jgi:digalactosyldiacylglycerol synthase
MAGFGVDTRPAAAAAGEGALSFISRSLREDLRLIRARAGELETFLSAPHPGARPLRARGKWEEEDAGEWNPIRAVKACLRDLNHRRQDQVTDVLHKVKLSLVSLLTHAYLKFVVMVHTCTCMFEK